MSYSNYKIIEACKVLAEQEGLQVTFRESAKAGLIVGVCTVFGALLGPFGIFGGAALGSSIAFATTKNYKSVVEIIVDMDESDKLRLSSHIENALLNIGVTDIAAISGLILGGGIYKQEALKAITNFMVQEDYQMLTD